MTETIKGRTVRRIAPMTARSVSGRSAHALVDRGPLLADARDRLAAGGSVLLTGPADPEQLGTAPFLLRQMEIAHVPAAANFVSLRKIAGGSRAQQPWFGFGDFHPVTLAQARATYSGGCGDSATLFRSIRRLLGLPQPARVFLCHDYKAPGRDHYAWETSIGAQRAGNIHVHDGVSEAAFVAMRDARDATLPMPRLMLPSVQVNMRGGHLPEPEDNGVRYLKLPLNLL